MKRLLPLLLIIPFIFLTSCKNEAEEEFTADFEITRRDTSPTSVIIDPDYIGETKVFDSDAVNYSDMENFFKRSLFSSDRTTLSVPSDCIRVAVTGSFTSYDIESLTDICETLNSVPSFVGIKEVLPNEADYIISFTDSEGFFIECDPYGSVSGAEISVPYTFSEEERYALLSTSLFRVCGFLNKCDTPLDSVLSITDPSLYITDTDLFLLDILYSAGESGMSEEDFLNAVKNNF